MTHFAKHESPWLCGFAAFFSASDKLQIDYRVITDGFSIIVPVVNANAFITGGLLWAEKGCGENHY